MFCLMHVIFYIRQMYYKRLLLLLLEISFYVNYIVSHIIWVYILCNICVCTYIWDGNQLLEHVLKVLIFIRCYNDLCTFYAYLCETFYRIWHNSTKKNINCIDMWQQLSFCRYLSVNVLKFEKNRNIFSQHGGII